MTIGKYYDHMEEREDHRAWLKEAIEAFRLGLPRPEQRN